MGEISIGRTKYLTRYNVDSSVLSVRILPRGDVPFSIFSKTRTRIKNCHSPFPTYFITPFRVVPRFTVHPVCLLSSSFSSSIYLAVFVSLDRTSVHSNLRTLDAWSMHVFGYVGARYSRDTYTYRETWNEHVAEIHVYLHTYRIVDERVHPSRRSHRSNLLGSCWNYVTLRRGG